MRAFEVVLAVTSVSLAGCATATGAPAGMERIDYETGPCFGACPVYRISVNADGTGLFEGRAATAFIGERSYRLTPEQYRSFAAHLAPLRPASGERLYTGDACGQMATDLPSVDVRWWAPDGSEQHLYFYYGCDMERNRAISDRLRSAPDHLPIGDLIGPVR